MVQSKKHFLCLVKKQTLEQGVTAFYFAKPQSFSFLSGQYLQLVLPHQADALGTTRFFSIASAPHEPELMLVIKKGNSSFKHLLWDLELGTQVEAFGPIGKFVLED